MSNFATEIYINNLLINDQLAKIDEAATARAGISLSWGRRSPLDQPSTSTLQASLLLPEARAAALIGRRIDKAGRRAFLAGEPQSVAPGAQAT